MIQEVRMKTSSKKYSVRRLTACSLVLLLGCLAAQAQTPWATLDAPPTGVAPPGEVLDSTLLKALLRSKTLLVVANRDMLQEPRWVRKEVEEYRSRRPDRRVLVTTREWAKPKAWF